MARWKEMLADTTFQSQMLIYCPEPEPKDGCEEKQRHPFASYGALGQSFPENPATNTKKSAWATCRIVPSRSSNSLPRRVRRDFDLIDNLAGGTQSHPRLQVDF